MLRLYNTATRQKEEFVPLRKGRVGMYSCGPTVYHYVHLGNLRAFLFSDIVRRTLELFGYRVRQVMNITDVGHLISETDSGDDKIEKAARREGKTAWDIADFYTKAFLDDLAALNIETPAKLPRATDFIKQQIALVRRLEEQEFAYRTDDGVYFDTAKFPAYADFARLRLESQKSGARVDAGGKKNPTDFALWKFSPPGKKRDMEWKSPWGVGFPGWHLECSVMSRELLGQPFDIHTGGEDHISIHHTNEIAQSVAAYGQPLARYWLHNAFLVLPGDEKMAKSAGNFVKLQDLMAAGFDPIAFRLHLLGTHYRKPLTYSQDALQSSQAALVDLRDRLREWPKPGKKMSEDFARRFITALEDDFNTPRALASFWELTGRPEPTTQDSLTVLWMDRVFGLRLKYILGKPLRVPSEIKKLVTGREKARASKDWKRADDIRKKIAAQGFQIEDTPAGPRVRSNPSI